MNKTEKKEEKFLEIYILRQVNTLTCIAKYFYDITFANKIFLLKICSRVKFDQKIEHAYRAYTCSKRNVCIPSDTVLQKCCHFTILCVKCLLVKLCDCT